MSKKIEEPTLPGVEVSKERPARRPFNAELQTMARLDRILSALPESSLRRVLDWLTDHYDEKLKPAPTQEGGA